MKTNNKLILMALISYSFLTGLFIGTFIKQDQVNNTIHRANECYYKYKIKDTQYRRELVKNIIKEN